VNSMYWVLDTLMCIELSIVVRQMHSVSAVSVHSWADLVMEVKVYRGLGGEHLSISEPWPHASHYGLQSVTAIIAERTHWLWGIDDSYLVLDMLAAEVLSWDHQFAVRCESGSPHLIQIIYLSYRLTNQGFPCRTCLRLYSGTRHGLPSFIVYQGLYSPGFLYCYSCGSQFYTYDMSGLELVEAGQVTDTLYFMQ
jgi:hypothetical protein